jgi:riboflavin biosynthesis pyrimidine reductase
VTLLCRAGTSAAASARRGALIEAGAEVVGMPTDESGGLDLRAIQSWLFEQGHRRVLLEAGPRLLGGYLEAGFVDQVRVYTGAVNGGRGPSMADWFGRLELAGRLDREVGGDAVLEGFPGPAD